MGLLLIVCVLSVIKSRLGVCKTRGTLELVHVPATRETKSEFCATLIPDLLSGSKSTASI